MECTLQLEVLMTRITLITLFITAVFANSGLAQTTTTPPKRHDSRLNGFLIGLLAGAVPGVMLGMGVKRYCENESRSCPIAVPVAGALFGFVGGGIGYAVDGAIGESRTFARPRPTPNIRFSIRF
jgi:hypothetical protein